MQTAKTAIIIVNYKTPWHLKSCLKSVFARSEDFHLYVVHNAPDQKSLQVTDEFAKRYPQHITVFINKENLGYVAGINTAYQAAVRHEYICLLNSDIIVTRSWLSELVYCLDADAHVVQVAPDSNHFYPERPWWKWGRAMVAAISPRLADRFYSWRLSMSPPRARHSTQGFTPYPHFFQFAGGYCNLSRASYFKDLGYILDPNIAHGYWDDSDMSFYLRQFGKIGYTNKSYVFHFLNTSLRSIGARKKTKAQLVQLNAMYVIHKWRVYIRAELEKLSISTRLEWTRTTDEMPVYLQYFALAQDQEFTKYIETIPAKQLVRDFLG